MPGFWRIFYTLLLEINENKPIRNFIWNEGVFLGIVFKWKNMERPRMIFFSEITTKALFKFYFPQIGFSNSSPLLSSKAVFPLYFRTNPSEKFSNLGRIAILRRFSWKKVAILQQNNDVFTGISNSLVDLLSAANLTVLAYESFKDHPKFAIKNLKVNYLKFCSVFIRQFTLSD